MKSHPSQVAYHYQQSLTALSGAVLLSLIGWGCVSWMSFVQNQALKLTAASTGLVCFVGASPLLRSHRRGQALLQDVDDISHDSWQTSLWQSLQDAAKLVDWNTDTPASLGLFDIATLTDPNGCTCAAIVGESGSGKSMLCQMLIATQFPNSSVKVYDTDAAPDEWGNLTVIGRKGDTSAIVAAMQQDLALLQQRTEQRGDGRSIQTEEIRVIEEFPTIAADLEDKNNPATNWLKRLVRRGRKYRMKVFLVSQEWNVEALRIGGEGELRKAFTVFYLGSSALDAIKKEPDKAKRQMLKQAISQQQRPCLVAHRGQLFAYFIPELSPVQARFNDGSDSVPVLPGSDAVKALNRLYSSSPSHPELLEPGDQFRLLPDEMKRIRIAELRTQGLNQTQIIFVLWGVRKGGSQAYKNAVAELKRLSG